MAEITKQCGCVVDRITLPGKGKVVAYADSIITECKECAAKRQESIAQSEAIQKEQEVQQLINAKALAMAQEQLIKDDILEVVNGDVQL